MKRKCNRCKQKKDISNFYKDKANSTGYGYKCKLCDNIARKERKQNNPWQSHLESLRKRCNYKKHDSYCYYGGKGIEALITLKEIKELWFRDKAYLLKKPSIDRKKNNKNYTYDNCQFIEMGINSTKSNFCMAKKILQYNLHEKIIKKWNSAKEIMCVLGYNDSYIRACCKGHYKTAHGFVWKYKSTKEKK